MSETQAPREDREDNRDYGGREHYDEPGLYEIRIKGHLDDGRAAWFEGLTLTREDNGDTLLAGPVVDQAALYGLLRRVRDLGMPLISVTLVRSGRADAKHVEQ